MFGPGEEEIRNWKLELKKNWKKIGNEKKRWRHRQDSNLRRQSPMPLYLSIAGHRLNHSATVTACVDSSGNTGTHATGPGFSRGGVPCKVYTYTMLCYAIHRPVQCSGIAGVAVVSTLSNTRLRCIHRLRQLFRRLPLSLAWLSSPPNSLIAP